MRGVGLDKLLVVGLYKLNSVGLYSPPPRRAGWCRTASPRCAPRPCGPRCSGHKSTHSKAEAWEPGEITSQARWLTPGAFQAYGSTAPQQLYSRPHLVAARPRVAAVNLKAQLRGHREAAGRVLHSLNNLCSWGFIFTFHSHPLSHTRVIISARFIVIYHSRGGARLRGVKRIRGGRF
jgi:hypothetical protein